MTPELFSDRGIAWVKATFEIAKVIIDDFGILALAIIAVKQMLKDKTHQKEIEVVKAQLNQQSEQINTNTQTIANVALAATPPPPIE